MKKKLTITLTMIMLLTTVLLVAGCGNDTAELPTPPEPPPTPEATPEPTPTPTPEPTPEPEPEIEEEPEPEIINPNRGLWDGTTYTNEYMGLSISFDGDWDLYINPEIFALWNDGFSFDYGEEISDDFWENNERWEEIRFSGRPTDDIGNVEGIWISYSIIEDPNITEENAENEWTTVQLGNYEWIELNHIDWFHKYMWIYRRTTNGFDKNIVIITTDDERLNEILSMFSTP